MRLLISLLVLLSPVAAQEKISESVARFLAPFCDESVDVAWHIEGRDAKGNVQLDVAFERKGADSFTLAVRSKPVRFLLKRTKARTELILPEHRRRFLAQGALEENAENIAPLGFMHRLLGSREGAPSVARIWVMARLATAKPASDGSLQFDDKIRIGSVDGDLRVHSSTDLFEGIRELRLTSEQVRVPEFECETVEVSRGEMERMIFRAVRRALEIYTPVLAPPPLPARKVAHGELRFVQGQRLVLLEGSPEEIGKAHGELLGPLIRRTLNSYVYLVGAVETVRTGKWFLGEMEQAWKRLSPHIPVRHRREMEALAAAVPGMSLREIRICPSTSTAPGSLCSARRRPTARSTTAASSTT
ncbi:MAG: hypothetical protein ACYS0E_05280 [Planctomycetota bacterium]|jgi:hypothetical protein